MGAWGTALYSDDLAADLRSTLRDYFGDGLSAAQAVDRLVEEYASSVNDPDEGPVFWLAIADTSWKLGRLDARARERALEIIDGGQDLARWTDARTSDRRKRAAVLTKLRERLQASPPHPKRIPKRIKAANDWAVGEVIGLRLKSGSWTLMRVIGHHIDKGGQFAVCELLDWTGTEIPTATKVATFRVRPFLDSHRANLPVHLQPQPQFFFSEPRKKTEKERIVRTGIVTTPAQDSGRYTVLVWKVLDRLLLELYGLS